MRLTTQPLTCVGVMWLTSSDASCFRRVVLPALSRPSSKMRNSLSGLDFSFRSSANNPCTLQTDAQLFVRQAVSIHSSTNDPCTLQRSWFLSGFLSGLEKKKHKNPCILYIRCTALCTHAHTHTHTHVRVRTHTHTRTHITTTTPSLQDTWPLLV